MSDVTVTRDIVVEGLLPHAPAVVWKTLTTADLIGRWLMSNDFEPVVGHRFTFKARPMGSWDGTVHCEVLEVEPERRLVYSWRGGSANNPAAPLLDSVVTWTLEPAEGGTRLELVHAGFVSPDNDGAYDGMSPGWSRVIAGIGRVAGEL